MSDDLPTKDVAADLRLEAIARLERERGVPAANNDRVDPDTARFIYELQVHQIELQMQNDQLRLARAELNAAVQRFTSLYDDAPLGYMTLDHVGTIREVNLTATRLLGIERSWLVHRRFALYLELDDRRKFADFLDQVFAGVTPLTTNVSPVASTHGPIVLRLDATLSVSATGAATECRVAITDITQQREVERSRDMQSAALDAAANGIFITDAQGIIESVNAAFTALTGYTAEDAIGKTPGALLNSGVHDYRFYAEMWGAMMDGRVWSGDVTNRRKDGTLFSEELTITPVRSVSGAILHFVAIGRDLTEKHLLAQQLMQAQRMETVGRLAGGIAHDFNNLLTVINGTASMALSELMPGDPMREDLREIEQAGKRAAVLTRQLLAFSRKQIMSFERLDLSQLLNGMRGVVQRLFGPNVVIRFALPPGLGLVRADPAQLEQVILNLVLNARDAMPGGGSLTISVRDCEVDADFTGSHPEVAQGPYVQLTIADTGSGMTPETAARIFEPFFTTKSVGEGTGLGLAMVYGIVKQSSGYVFVESEVDVGSTFTIYLPRTARDATDAPSFDEPTSVLSDRGSETVLIVEDEPAVRRLAERILRAAGYEVLIATNGAEALALFSESDLHVDLVLTDMVMPGMTGTDLANALKTLRPNLRYIFTSGYTSNPSLALSTEVATANFIAKPYTSTELTRLVREVLDARVTPSQE